MKSRAFEFLSDAPPVGATADSLCEDLWKAILDHHRRRGDDTALEIDRRLGRLLGYVSTVAVKQTTKTWTDALSGMLDELLKRIAGAAK